MKRKLIVVLAALLILCIPITALAMTESKTTGDVTTTTADDPEFVLKPIQETDAFKALFESVFQFVNENNGSPINFFDDALKSEISSKYPDGTDVTNLQLNEFVAIKGYNYSESVGDQTVSFSFASEYTEDQTLVAALAIFNPDGTVSEWIVLDAQVVNGKVVITFPQDVLEKLSTNSGALAIFNN